MLIHTYTRRFFKQISHFHSFPSKCSVSHSYVLYRPNILLNSLFISLILFVLQQLLLFLYCLRVSYSSTSTASHIHPSLLALYTSQPLACVNHLMLFHLFHLLALLSLHQPLLHPLKRLTSPRVHGYVTIHVWVRILDGWMDGILVQTVLLSRSNVPITHGFSRRSQ